jgi:tRNA pseudouridine55 synthase
VGAHVTALRRTRSGPFSLVEARPLDAVLDALAEGAEAAPALPLVPPAEALRHLERRLVTDAVARDARHGKRIVLETGEDARDRRLCLVDAQGKLVAVARPRPDRTLELLRVFLA